MTEIAVIEAIRSAQGVNGPDAIQAAAAQAAQAVADPNAIAAFNEAMGVAATADVPFASQISGAWHGAQDAYQDHLHRLKSLSESGEMGTMSVANMSALQYEIANTNFQLEVTVSVAKKSSDAVQTLVKNG